MINDMQIDLTKLPLLLYSWGTNSDVSQILDGHLD